MSKENGVVLAFGLIWILVKMTFFLSGESEMSFFAGSMANILFVLLVAFWALQIKYKSRVAITSEDGDIVQERRLLPEDSNFLDDLKTSMKAAGKYILIVSAFVYIYYSGIDTEYGDRIVQQRTELAQEQTATEESWQKVIENAPSLENTTKEEYVEKVTENAKEWTSPGRQTSLTLFGLFMLSVFYSVLLVVLFRKLLYRNITRQ